MKNFSIILFLLCMVTAVQAQDKKKDHNGFMKGDKYISGLIGFNSISNANGSKETTFKVSPRFGYFINDFVAVGGRLGYNQSQSKANSGTKLSDNTTLTAEIFGRYYLLPGSKFSVFGELGVGFGSTRNISKEWTNGINADFSPGLSYFVGQHFALEAIFGILAYHTVSPGGNSGSTDSFSVGLDLENIHFGIIYKF